MPAGMILVADDDSAIRTVLNQALGRAGYDVRTTGTAAGLWRWVQSGEGNLVITDVVLPDENGFDLIPRIKRVRPDLPIVVMSAQNTILTAITAAERGAFEYLPKPFDLKELVSVVQRGMATPRNKRDADAQREAGEERLPIIGRSPAMQEIYRVIARLTQTDLTVMIMGESGTGKELVARALHDYGRRRHGPFVAVNMAAIPKELVESELFGHERGAFTGAANRGIGRFEQAEGGTLFLDEIGDMPLEAQTRLRPPIANCGSSSIRACSAKTCTTASMSCRSGCRHCASGARTSPISYGISCTRRKARAFPSSGSTPTRSNCCGVIAGRAMCANWKTSSGVLRCCIPAIRSQQPPSQAS
jgi:two-component system nitrogen regulation response regulator GlnG